MSAARYLPQSRKTRTGDIFSSEGLIWIAGFRFRHLLNQSSTPRQQIAVATKWASDVMCSYGHRDLQRFSCDCVRILVVTKQLRQVDRGESISESRFQVRHTSGTFVAIVLLRVIGRLHAYGVSHEQRPHLPDLQG